MELARWLRAPNEKQDAPERRGEALRNQELCVGERASPALFSEMILRATKSLDLPCIWEGYQGA